MKKQLNTIAVLNELKGASVFFPSKEAIQEPKPDADTTAPETKPHGAPDTSPPRSSALLSHPDNFLAEIRNAIKEQGREVSYVRLTQSEKNQLSDIIYSYKRQGIKTTETEIGRIAINYLIEDYQANGKASILACLLASLHD